MSRKIYSVTAYRTTPPHPARTKKLMVLVGPCPCAKHLRYVDNRNSWNGIIPNSGAPTRRVPSLSRRASSRSFGFAALRDITFPMLDVDVFAQRRFSDVAEPTTPKLLRLAVLRAPSTLSPSSPNCLSSLVYRKKPQPHLHPCPPSKWDLTLDIASRSPPLAATTNGQDSYCTYERK